MTHRCPSCGYATEIASARLSPRERQVFLLKLNGYNYKEIAEGLDISFYTVKSILEKVYTRMGVNTLRQRREGTTSILAMNIALQTGQIKLSDLKIRHVKQYDYDL